MRVWGFGFRVSGLGFRDSGFEFEVSGFGFRVSGFRQNCDKDVFEDLAANEGHGDAESHLKNISSHRGSDLVLDRRLASVSNLLDHFCLHEIALLRGRAPLCFAFHEL